MIYFQSEICYPDGIHTFAKTSLYSTIWAPPHERVHTSLVPAPRPLTVLIPGSQRVPPLVPTRRKVLSMPKTFAGSRRPLTGHQRVHRLLNAPPCALTVFHRPHEIYHTAPCHSYITFSFGVSYRSPRFVHQLLYQDIYIGQQS